MEVHTFGISCHGSAPERGDNAIYKMADIVSDIDKLNERLEPHEPLGKGSVTISEIRSTSPSLCAVADGCTIHLDRRLTIGETEETSVAEILALPSVQAAGARVTVLDYQVPSYTGLSYPTRKYYPTWETPEDDPAILACKGGTPGGLSARNRKRGSGPSAPMAWQPRACTAFRPSDSGPGMNILPMHPMNRPKSNTWCAAPRFTPPSSILFPGRSR